MFLCLSRKVTHTIQREVLYSLGILREVQIVFLREGGPHLCSYAICGRTPGPVESSFTRPHQLDITLWSTHFFKLIPTEFSKRLASPLATFYSYLGVASIFKYV